MAEMLSSDQAPFWTTGSEKGYYGQFGDNEVVVQFAESGEALPSTNNSVDEYTSID